MPHLDPEAKSDLKYPLGLVGGSRYSIILYTFMGFQGSYDRRCCRNSVGICFKCLRVDLGSEPLA
jgi:hypothetical protein